MPPQDLMSAYGGTQQQGMSNLAMLMQRRRGLRKPGQPGQPTQPDTQLSPQAPQAAQDSQAMVDQNMGQQAQIPSNPVTASRRRRKAGAVQSQASVNPQQQQLFQTGLGATMGQGGF
jgi:hypothetical protein